MPEKVEACVRSVMDDNPDMSEDRAWAICKSQEQEGNLKDGAELADGCPQGEVNINGECVAVESVDAPASLLSAPRIMASASPLDTQPIEREELGGGKVAYRGLKLIDSGVWTDSGSEKATLYDERTFENTTADYNTRKYEGPPVNIAHDLHKKGPQKGEPHEASIGGYIDPDSIETDGEALFGDLILDRETDAGAFADTNLKSALENEGSAGFSPSVELMPTEFGDADHSHAEEYVSAAELTGLGLVRDPASKSVDLAYETQNRAVALSSMGRDSPKAKLLTHEDDSMSQHKKIRDALLSRQLQVGDIQDDAQNIADELGVPIDEVMAVLDPLMDPPEEDEDGGEEMQEEEDEFPDEEEEEEEQEMQDDPDDPVDALQEQVQNLSSRLEDLEDAVAQAMTAEDVDAELEDAAGQKLADMDSVKELEEAREELDRRLEALESRGKESKTLADAGGDVDYSDADSGIDFDPATGSMSR